MAAAQAEKTKEVIEKSAEASEEAKKLADKEQWKGDVVASCPGCGFELASPNVKFCTECGYPVGEEKIICSKCGTNNPWGSDF